MDKILVTGSNGQLGSELQQLSNRYTGYEFLFTTRKELAIENEHEVQEFFKKHQPQFCINCAAYTAVDKAEKESDNAFLVNATAVSYLAKAAAQYNTQLIHVSTDYVFDGTATHPYKETHSTHPLGVYGASKLEGERLVQEYDPAAIIIRTSWVYSSYGNNFVKTMLRLMNERESINVVNDQTGSPTYAADLGKAILDIISSGKKVPGIYNYSNEGVITWYDFAVAIKEFTNSKCVVNPIPTSSFPTPAKRPAYSVFDKAKIKTTFGLSIPEWKDSLQHCLLQIMQYLAK